MEALVSTSMVFLVIGLLSSLGFLLYGGKKFIDAFSELKIQKKEIEAAPFVGRDTAYTSTVGSNVNVTNDSTVSLEDFSPDFTKPITLITEEDDDGNTVTRLGEKDGKEK